MERCSFCNQESKDVLILIKSDTGAIICDNCLALCNVMLAEKIEEKTSGSYIAINQELIDMVPAEFAVAYKIVPFYFKNGVLTVAGLPSTIIPEISMNLKHFNKGRVDKIGFITWPRESDIINAINKYYAGKDN